MFLVTVLGLDSPHSTTATGDLNGAGVCSDGVLGGWKLWVSESTDPTSAIGDLRTCREVPGGVEIRCNETSRPARWGVRAEDTAEILQLAAPSTTEAGGCD
mmetsp:Transcript_61422/g.163440  ORF Transcript_61422/g.163440 Transcript_61422/m.163440 type:complete len:101 (+) Transcript_61422:1574-1876(+)